MIYVFDFKESNTGSIEIEADSMPTREAIRKEIEKGNAVYDDTEYSDFKCVETRGKSKQFSIYQLKHKDSLAQLLFMNYDYLCEHGLKCSFDNYDRIYTGYMEPNDNLDSLYERFNIAIPPSFKGHSLSVSDVIVVRHDGQVKAYYVDDVGFKELAEFERIREERTPER